VWLHIGNTAILLEPHREGFIMTDIRQDQTATLSVEAIDALGNPVPGIFDSPPVWTNSNDAAATLSVTGDVATLTPVAGAVGQSTTVSVTASIGGAPFSASIGFTDIAALIAGIRIVVALNPP
jgi:hypothetical protein